MSITETEIVKHLVKQASGDNASINGSKSSTSVKIDKLHKAKNNELFQTLLIQWNTYLREIKLLMIKMVETDKTAILDTKLIGKYLVDC
jgi:hypothetical protein